MSRAAVLRGGVPRPLLTSFLLWYGVFGAAVVWLVRISAASALVPYACATGRLWAVHLTTAGALVLSASAAGVAWRGWRRWEGGGEQPGTRSHLIALSGLLLSGVFIVAIVFEGVAAFFHHPCQ